MKWLVYALAGIGTLLIVLGMYGARRDARDGRQSSDVSMINGFVVAIGFAFWGLDAAVIVLWVLAGLLSK